MLWPVNPLRGKTTDGRAVCGKSACTVRRGEGSNSIDPSYPYRVQHSGGVGDRRPTTNRSFGGGESSHRNDPAIYRSHLFDTWQWRRGTYGFVDAAGSGLFVDVSPSQLCHSTACRPVFPGLKTAGEARRKWVENLPPTATHCHFWGTLQTGTYRHARVQRESVA